MICLVASSYLFAKKWARSQHLRDEEWFYASDITELYKRKSFHVLLVVEGIEHVSNSYVNLMLTTAWEQGKKK